MKTILAEKPSVARTIASVIGASQRKDGYLEGNGYFVTWAIGHLVGLSMPESYGFPKWSLDHLPILPEPFRLQVADDAGLKKQFNIIKSLFDQSNQIIVATDAGREGELIFRYIYQLTSPSKQTPVKRLWISDLTDATIKKGMSELRPIAEFDRIYLAAKARSEADWLVGINFTQGYTLASGKRKPLSIGRVQTATLRLVVDRFLENQGFESKPFYVPQLVFADDRMPFVLSCETKYANKDDAEQLLQGLKGTISPEIVREDKETKEKPPLLYDLTTLQRTANKAYNYTAQKTLDVLQALYEKHKIITYPRTDSQHLANNQKDEVAHVLQGLAGFDFEDVNTEQLKKECLTNLVKSPVFNDAKVSDHHAIIPTGNQMDLSALDEYERHVFLMIVKRFYQCFLSECIKANRKLHAIVRDKVFMATTTQTIKKGWRILSHERDPETQLPEITKGEQRTILDCTVHEGKTKPKPLFTENSLLGSMETAGQFVQDKELREGLKERGIGTPATRASMIETLIKREYMKRDKSKLIPTELGIALIDSLRELSICSPELTGEWEYRLKQVERKELDYNTFIKDIKTYVNELFPLLLQSGKKVAEIKTPEEKTRSESFGICPKCQKGEIRKGDKAFYCSNWNQDPKCDFTIWTTTFNKRLTDAQVKQLVIKGHTNKIKGFKNKSGKSFEAKLKFTDDYKIKPCFD